MKGERLAGVTPLGIATTAARQTASSHGLIPPQREGRGERRGGRPGKGLGAPRQRRGAGRCRRGPALTLPVVPSPSTTSLSWRSGLSSSSESDMVPPPPAGKEKRRRAAGRDGAQERGGEGGKARAPRSRSRQRCRGRSRHLPSARPPSLWPARDETTERREGRGRGQLAGGSYSNKSKSRRGGTRDALTSASPPSGRANGSARLAATRSGGLAPK